ARDIRSEQVAAVTLESAERNLIDSLQAGYQVCTHSCVVSRLNNGAPQLALDGERPLVVFRQTHRLIIPVSRRLAVREGRINNRRSRLCGQTFVVKECRRHTNALVRKSNVQD